MDGGGDPIAENGQLIGCLECCPLTGRLSVPQLKTPFP